MAATAPAVLALNLPAHRQLFNTLDPSPLRERDMDPAVVEYIVEWAEDQPAHAELAMVVTVNEQVATEHDLELLRAALREEFRRRASSVRRRLGRLFRDGRVSLLIGMVFLALAIVISDVIGNLLSYQRYVTLVQETVVIGGWVALWHPINIFLYEWWPIRAEARLLDRLSQMDVSLCGASLTYAGRTEA